MTTISCYTYRNLVKYIHEALTEALPLCQVETLLYDDGMTVIARITIVINGDQYKIPCAFQLSYLISMYDDNTLDNYLATTARRVADTFADAIMGVGNAALQATIKPHLHEYWNGPQIQGVINKNVGYAKVHPVWQPAQSNLQYGSSPSPVPHVFLCEE